MIAARTPRQWLDNDGRPGPLLQACLAAAVAAPSVHNTQPWLFHVRGNSVDVSADRDRQLAVIDFTGREQMISVGAAIFNLRAAMLADGWLPVQSLWPAAGEDGPAARIAPSVPIPAPRSAKALAWAIPRRRTNRGPFKDLPLPSTVTGALDLAARTEGAVLRFADPETRAGLFGLVNSAERQWVNDPAYRHELGRWTRMDPGRRDGIPFEAIGPRSAGNAVPLRDLGLANSMEDRQVTRFEPAPTVAVLYAGDGPREWLRAGQALQRVLLTATVWGVAATLMTQPLEIPALRELISEADTDRYAQAIIRFGYPVRPAAPSPRRPWSDLLRIDG
jgi:nitroreductase